MRLYIIRHGDPNYETDTLTEQGKSEAAALSRQMADFGIDRIFASPLGRAQETARFTATPLGLPVDTEEWLREKSELLDVEQQMMIWDQDPGLLAQRPLEGQGAYFASEEWKKVPPFDHPLLGKVIADVKNGSDDLLARLGFERHEGVYAVTRENREAVAVFCHNGTALFWLAHLLRIPLVLVWSGFFMHTSSYTTILFEERRAGFAMPRCIGFGELGHLHRAGVAPGLAGLKANTI